MRKVFLFLALPFLFGLAIVSSGCHELYYGGHNYYGYENHDDYRGHYKNKHRNYRHRDGYRHGYRDGYRYGHRY